MALQSQVMRNDPQLQAAANNQPPLRTGVRGSGVQILQRCLIAQGFSMPITTCQGKQDPDGIYGDETRSVVALFQRREGLSADGIAGHDTLHRLDSLQATTPPAAIGERPLIAPEILHAKDQLFWRTVCHWT